MRMLQKEFALFVHIMTLLLTATGAVLLALCWFSWQLLRQNGRILLRLDELEKRLDHFEFGEGERLDEFATRTRFHACS